MYRLYGSDWAKNWKGTSIPTGTVKWFKVVQRYGSIAPDDGSRDAFVHISSVERAGFTELREGQKVEYELVPGRNGRKAADNLKLLD